MFENVNKDTVGLYAAKAYDKPSMVQSEFIDDLRHFSYVRRLLRRYRQYGELRERLILNHLIILYNLFGVPAATRLLYYYVRPEDYSILKTFLIFLDRQPEVIPGINGRDIHSTDYSLDPHVVEILRTIRNIS
jgi:hypothetical protein